MRLFFIALFFFAGTQTAAACHRFSVWKYPWPQRCAAHSRSLNETRIIGATPPQRHDTVIVDIVPPPFWHDDWLRARALEQIKQELRN